MILTPLHPVDDIDVSEEHLEPLRFVITEDLVGFRLDKALTVLATPLCSRERLKSLILEGCVHLNGTILKKPSH
ncbi:MAG: S4 domain-containing protein, partial [Candidatus Melainabacteria bacterium]|nr:S4 domain-containing protein [Candidatus Melainabacteria bacterium]